MVHAGSAIDEADVDVPDEARRVEQRRDGLTEIRMAGLHAVDRTVAGDHSAFGNRACQLSSGTRSALQTNEIA